jgi:hypothetical protein
MEEFPFSADDWNRVEELATEIVNASAMDDDVLGASKVENMREHLAELRDRYGEHPILIETEADFEDDPLRRKDLYLAAIALAEANALPSYTIRISLAGVLIDELHDPLGAAQQLSACERETQQQGDDDQRRQWGELMQRCAAIDPGGTP